MSQFNKIAFYKNLSVEGKSMNHCMSKSCAECVNILNSNLIVDISLLCVLKSFII